MSNNFRETSGSSNNRNNNNEQYRIREHNDSGPNQPEGNRERLEQFHSEAERRRSIHRTNNESIHVSGGNPVNRAINEAMQRDGISHIFGYSPQESTVNDTTPQNQSNDIDEMYREQERIIRQHGGSANDTDNIIFNIDNIISNIYNTSNRSIFSEQDMTSDLTLPRYEKQDPLPQYRTREKIRTDISQTTSILFSNDHINSRRLLEAHYEYPSDWKGPAIPNELECLTSSLDRKKLINALKDCTDPEDSFTSSGNVMDKLPDKPIFENWVNIGKDEYRDQSPNNREPLSGHSRLDILDLNVQRSLVFLDRMIDKGDIQGNDFKNFKNYTYDTICNYVALSKNLNRGFGSILETYARMIISGEGLNNKEISNIRRKWQNDVKQSKRYKGRALESRDMELYSKVDKDDKKLEEIYRDARTIGQYEAVAIGKYEIATIGSLSTSKDLQPNEERWKEIVQVESDDQLSVQALEFRDLHKCKYSARKLGEALQNEPDSHGKITVLRHEADQSKSNYRQTLEKCKEYELTRVDNNKAQEIQERIDKLDEHQEDYINIGKKTLNQMSRKEARRKFTLEYDEATFLYYQSYIKHKKDAKQLEEVLSTPHYDELATKEYESRLEKERLSKVWETLRDKHQKARNSFVESRQKGKKLAQGNRQSYESYKALWEKYGIQVADHPDFVKYGFEN